MAEDQIAKKINSMGYVTCRPLQITPCYYKINDGTGTILCVVIAIHHIAPRAGRAQGFDVDSSLQVSVFTPATNRSPENFVPYSEADLASTIAVRDVDYDVLREEFSVYFMSDGTTLSVKAAMGQIDKTGFVTPHGEPIYIVNPLPVTKIRHVDT